MTSKERGYTITVAEESSGIILEIFYHYGAELNRDYNDLIQRVIQANESVRKEME